MNKRNGTLLRALGTIGAITLSIAGCSMLRSNASPPQDLIDQMPDPFDGELYFESIVDGSCRTDCPDPAIARGWLVPCEQLEQRFDAAVSHFESLGYTKDDSVPNPAQPSDPKSGSYVVLRRSERDETADVLARSDPENGSQPNVAPYDTPASVRGRCAVVASITRPR